jgi:hypothetical protein
MHRTELYRKYRRLIEELADERRPIELSLAGLHPLLQEFQHDAAALGSDTASFVCDELADQLEHEALRSTRRHRRDILNAAVKAFDCMSFCSDLDGSVQTGVGSQQDCGFSNDHPRQEKHHVR